MKPKDIEGFGGDSGGLLWGLLHGLTCGSLLGSSGCSSFVTLGATTELQSSMLTNEHVLFDVLDCYPACDSHVVRSLENG